jgi:serine carboxypeptidase-like clade 2
MTLLHINTAKTLNPWNMCTGINYTKDPRASYYLYVKLIKRGLRIWKMSGDVIIIVLTLN